MKVDAHVISCKGVGETTVLSAPTRNDPANETLRERVLIGKPLVEKLTAVCLEALPAKAYGLVGGKDPHHPESIYPCSTNLRNTPEWKSVFESFGDFYKDPDRGFVISPDEYRQVLEKMEAAGQSFVGVYHSHRCHHSEPSQLDMALHVDPTVLSYIVSVVDPDKPEIKIYRLERTVYAQIPFRVI
jgi:proteasome lid subunit RPN8/RPN11